MIEEGDRVFCSGITGSGKSRLLGYFFAMTPGQRLLVDVNDDYELGPAAIAEGCSNVRGDPAALDFSQRTLRYVPGRLDQAEYDELYKVIWGRACAGHRLFVWLDECLGPTTESSSPLHVRLVLGQGRKKALTHAGASLRPVGIEKMLVNQSEHYFAFFTADRDDLERIARRFSVTPAELAAALEPLAPGGAQAHGFLYHRLGQPQVSIFPALPQAKLDLLARHVRMP